jgi:hypothetical protein
MKCRVGGWGAHVSMLYGLQTVIAYYCDGC